MALGSVVGAALLLASVFVVAHDLRRGDGNATRLAAGSNTTAPGLELDDTSTTTVAGPTPVTGVSPTSSPVPGPVSAPPTTGEGTAPPTAQVATTTTLVPGPPAGGGATILQPASGPPIHPATEACNGLTQYGYVGGDMLPACGDVATGDTGTYHLFWVIEPGRPPSDTASPDRRVVSVWGKDQTAGSSPTWSLKLKAMFDATRYQVPTNPVPVSMAVPLGPVQLAFGFHDASGATGSTGAAVATQVHVDVVQVTRSGPAASVAVGLHVDANLATASPGRLDAYNNSSHQVIRFYEGAWRVQRTDTAAAGPTNL